MSISGLIWGLLACLGVLCGTMLAARHAAQVAGRRRQISVRPGRSAVRRVTLADACCKREKELRPLRMVGSKDDLSASRRINDGKFGRQVDL